MKIIKESINNKSNKFILDESLFKPLTEDLSYYQDRVSDLLSSELVDTVEATDFNGNEAFKLTANDGKVLYLVPSTLSQVDVYDNQGNVLDTNVFWRYIIDEFVQTEEAGFVYQLVGGDCAGTYTIDELKNLPCFDGKYTADQSEIRNNGGFTHRKELDNQPELNGYLGPMFNGWGKNHNVILRYETQEVYDALSESYLTEDESTNMDDKAKIAKEKSANQGRDSDEATEARFQQLVAKLDKIKDYTQFVKALKQLNGKQKALFIKEFGRTSDSIKPSVQSVGVKTTQLFPTQSEIDWKKSLSRGLAQDCSNFFKSPVTLGMPVLTYNNKYILDGHHRWSQVAMFNPEGEVACINFSYPQGTVVDVLKDTQAATLATLGKVPEGSAGTNLFTVSEEELRSYISANISDDCWQSIVNAGKAKDKEGVINYIVGNAMKLNKPAAGAPDRTEMPQTTTNVINRFKQGITDMSKYSGRSEFTQKAQPKKAANEAFTNKIGLNEAATVETFSQWFDKNQYHPDSKYYPFDNYVQTFENAEVLRNATAEDIRDNAHQFYDIYDVDSIDREYAFQFASKKLGMNYDDFYRAWLNKKPISVKNESVEDELYTKEQVEQDLKSITNNFTEKEGELKCGFEEEKNFGVEILKQHYKIVEVSGDDRREGAWYHISYAEPKNLKEGFSSNIDLDRIIIDVANLLDEEELGDNWIEVFPAREVSPYKILLEITGADETTRKAFIYSKPSDSTKVCFGFRNGSEGCFTSAKEIARFIAGEYGLNLNESKSIRESSDSNGINLGDTVRVKVANNRIGTVTKLIGNDLIEVEFEAEGRYPARNDRYYTSDVELLDNDLTICPNCGGTRFNDNTGFCIDCGYDERSYGDLDESKINEADYSSYQVEFDSYNDGRAAEDVKNKEIFDKIKRDWIEDYKSYVNKYKKYGLYDFNNSDIYSDELKLKSNFDKYSQDKYSPEDFIKIIENIPYDKHGFDKSIDELRRFPEICAFGINHYISSETIKEIVPDYNEFFNHRSIVKNHYEQALRSIVNKWPDQVGFAGSKLKNGVSFDNYYSASGVFVRYLQQAYKDTSNILKNYGYKIYKVPENARSVSNYEEVSFSFAVKNIDKSDVQKIKDILAPEGIEVIDATPTQTTYDRLRTGKPKMSGDKYESVRFSVWMPDLMNKGLRPEYHGKVARLSIL